MRRDGDKRMTIDREIFLQEQALRTYLRKRIVELHEKQTSNESILRESVRNILLEGSGGEVAPHESTGINVLEDVLKKIIPVLEDAYKRLTTNFEQRNSFSNHIVQAVKNSLAPIVAIDKLSGKDNLGENQSYVYSVDSLQKLLEDITVDIGNDEEEISDEVSGGFIDIDGDGVTSDTFGLDGEDETGRNFAEDSFNRIESVIIDAYSMLSGEEDKKLFYEYLLTNLKLYFDKFEDELKNILPDYEDPEVETPIEDDEEEASDPDEGDFFS